ncbi:MFS transporter [Bradyrhizobium sp. sBnM-33]|uniref:MFS transporter n=1 Tax=Bradyrhizobium sp. sBnM-33 TaxID=2831780 RepID=UPI00390CBB88
MLGGLWITIIFTLLTATSADSFLSFCILRLLTGIGLGVLLPLATTYINELAPRRVANTLRYGASRLAGHSAARSPVSPACLQRQSSLDIAVLDRLAVVSALAVHAHDAAGIAKIPRTPGSYRRNPRHADEASARARRRLQVG